MNRRNLSRALGAFFEELSRESSTADSFPHEHFGDGTEKLELKRRNARAILEGILPARWVHLGDLIAFYDGAAFSVWLGLWALSLNALFGATSSKFDDVTRLAIAAVGSNWLIVAWRLYAHYLDDAIVEFYRLVASAEHDLGIDPRLSALPAIVLAPKGRYRYWLTFWAARRRPDECVGHTPATFDKFKRRVRLDLASWSELAGKKRHEILQQLTQDRLMGFRGHQVKDALALAMILFPTIIVLMYGWRWEHSLRISYWPPPEPALAIIVSAALALGGTCKIARTYQRDPTIDDLRELDLLPLDAKWEQLVPLGSQLTRDRRSRGRDASHPTRKR